MRVRELAMRIPCMETIEKAEMSIRYTTKLGSVGPEQLSGFFEWWPNPPSPEKHLRMLRGSDHCVLAIDGRTDAVIGFINAITDQSHFAFIPLLEVLPGYRRRGIGSELVRRMLDELHEYYAIDLRCDEALQAFYEPLGFTRSLGMLRRNYPRQASGVTRRT